MEAEKELDDYDVINYIGVCTSGGAVRIVVLLQNIVKGFIHLQRASMPTHMVTNCIVCCVNCVNYVNCVLCMCVADERQS